MNERRAGVKNRCQKCHINKSLCFCRDLKKVNHLTKVSIIMHVSEQKLSSNTARLCSLVSNNTEIYVRGHVEKKFDANQLIDTSYSQIFLFPDEDAKILDENFLSTIKKPIQLIIPDGNWHQAKKVKKREKAFLKIPSVKLNTLNKSIYLLRRVPFDGALCTFEAISYALGVIEEPSIRKKMLENLKIMVDRTLKARIGV